MRQIDMAYPKGLERRDFLRIASVAAGVGAVNLLAPDMLTLLMKRLNTPDLASKTEIPHGSVLFGASVNSHSDIKTLEDVLGKKVDISNIFHTWFLSDEAQVLNDIHRTHQSGLIPMVSWRPGFAYDSLFGFRLNRVEDFEPYIRQTAKTYRDLGFNFLFRMGYEMNDETSHIGPLWNTPKEFTHFWRWTKQIFTDEGANNVKWVWSVKQRSVATSIGLTPDIEAYYPGDDCVDLLGADVYGRFRNDFFDPHRYVANLSPDEVVVPMVSAFQKISNKPWLLTEVNGFDAQWVGDAITVAVNYGARAIMPFLIPKTGIGETNWWQIISDQSDAEILKTVLANPAFRSP